MAPEYSSFFSNRKLVVTLLSVLVFFVIFVLVSTLFSSFLTAFFVVLIAFFFIAAFIFRLFPDKWGTFGHKFVQVAPSFVMSLGVLGTFVGIVAGLRSFDTAAIEQSVPTLLNGLKTAFDTSVAGMIASLLLKLAFSLLDGLQEEDNDSQDEDLGSVLTSIHSEIMKSVGLQNQLRDEIYHGISQIISELKGFPESMPNMGDLRNEMAKFADSQSQLRDEINHGNFLIVSELRGFSEPLSEISALRNDAIKFVDLQSQLRDELRRLSEIASEIGSKQISSALEEVLERFNVLLGNAAGFAFKELRGSIDLLNHWQQSHHSQVQESHLSLVRTLEMVVEASRGIDKIAGIFEGLELQFDSIADSMQKINLDSKQISETTNGLSDQSQVLAEGLRQIQSLGEASGKAIPKLSERLSGFLSELEVSMDSQISTIQSLRDDLRLQSGLIRKTNEEQARIIEQYLENVHNSLNETWGQSIDTMVGAMTRVSQKFANDYTPLTEKLRKLISIADEVSPPERERR